MCGGIWHSLLDQEARRKERFRVEERQTSMGYRPGGSWWILQISQVASASKNIHFVLVL